MGEKADAQTETNLVSPRLSGQNNRYEEDGLRVCGDHEDHDREPPVRNPVTHSRQ